MASVVRRFINNHKLLSLVAGVAILMGGNALVNQMNGGPQESATARVLRQAQGSGRIEIRTDRSGLNVAQAQQNRVEDSVGSAFAQVMAQGRLAASGYGTDTSGIQVQAQNTAPQTINDQITAAGIGVSGGQQAAASTVTPAPQNPQSFAEVMALARQNRANGVSGIQTPAPAVETPAPAVTPAPQNPQSFAEVMAAARENRAQAQTAVETPAPAAETPAPAVETPAPTVETPAPVQEARPMTQTERKEALKAIGRYMAEEREALNKLNAMMGMDDAVNAQKGFGMYLNEDGEYEIYGLDQQTGLQKVTDTIVDGTKGAWNGTIDAVSSILPSQQQVGDALDAITPTKEGLQKIWDGTVQMASDAVDYVTPSKETVQVVSNNLTFEKGTTMDSMWQSVKGGFRSVVDALTPSSKTADVQVAETAAPAPEVQSATVEKETPAPTVAQAEPTVEKAADPTLLEEALDAITPTKEGWNRFVDNLTFEKGTTMDTAWQDTKEVVSDVADAVTPTKEGWNRFVDNLTFEKGTTMDSVWQGTKEVASNAVDTVTTKEGWNKVADNLTFEKGTTMDTAWQATKSGVQTAYTYVGDQMEQAKNWTVRQFEPDPYVVTIATPNFGALPIVLPAEMNPNPRTFMERTGDRIAAAYDKYVPTMDEVKDAGQTVANAFTTKEGFNKMVDGTAQAVKELPEDVSNLAQKGWDYTKKGVQNVAGLFHSDKTADVQTAAVQQPTQTQSAETYTYVGTGAEDVNITINALKPAAEKTAQQKENTVRTAQPQEKPKTLAEFLKAKGLSDADVKEALSLANKEADRRAQLKWSGKGLGLEESEQAVSVSTTSALKQKLTNGRG